MTMSSSSLFSAVSMRGSKLSSCCRSASMTAMKGEELARTPSMHAAYVRFRAADCAHVLRRTIPRIVVDEDGFPFDPGEHCFQARDQRLDIVALVEGGKNDGELD